MPVNTENILKKSQSSGKETDVKMSGNIVHQTLGRCVYPGYSENQEHSQNLPEKQAVDEMEHVNVKMSVQEDQCSLGDSDFSKHSQNSLSKGEPKVDQGEANVSFGDRDGQCLVMVSKFRELSPNSWEVMEFLEGRQKKHHTRPVCIGESSEYSRDLLGGVSSNVSVPRFSWFKSMSQIVGLRATWQDKVEGNPTGANTASNAKINTNPVHTEFNFFL